MKNMSALTHTTYNLHWNILPQPFFFLAILSCSGKSNTDRETHYFDVQTSLNYNFLLVAIFSSRFLDFVYSLTFYNIHRVLVFMSRIFDISFLDSHR